MTFGIIVNTTRVTALKVASGLIAWLNERGLNYIVEKQSAALLKEKKRCDVSQLGEKSDIIISLGGDGTILRAARYSNSKPILGVNLGRLGFLTEFTTDELFAAIERIVKKQYRIETRTRLEAYVKHGKKEHRFKALNEVIVEKGIYPRVPLISIRIDGHLLSDYKADGVIISTSTGSTAYSMSAGGPIIVPKSKVFVITPICPHMLTVRPIVISDEKVIEISVETHDKNFVLSCDGSMKLELSPKCHVKVYKSKTPVNLIANESRNYYDVLRTKFLWGKEYEK